MGLSSENLAKIIYTDKQRMFVEECFAYQVEMAQRPISGRAACGFAWQAYIARLATHHLIVTLAVRPFRLTVQWV